MDDTIVINYQKNTKYKILLDNNVISRKFNFYINVCFNNYINKHEYDNTIYYRYSKVNNIDTIDKVVYNNNLNGESDDKFINKDLEFKISFSSNNGVSSYNLYVEDSIKKINYRQIGIINNSNNITNAMVENTFIDKCYDFYYFNPSKYKISTSYNNNFDNVVSFLDRIYDMKTHELDYYIYTDKSGDIYTGVVKYHLGKTYLEVYVKYNDKPVKIFHAKYENSDYFWKQVVEKKYLYIGMYNEYYYKPGEYVENNKNGGYKSNYQISNNLVPEYGLKIKANYDNNVKKSLVLYDRNGNIEEMTVNGKKITFNTDDIINKMGNMNL